MAAFHFAANLRHLKALIKPWAHEKRIRDARYLTQVEADIAAAILAQEGGGLRTQEDFVALKRLESRRTTLLLEREETWQPKSRATWLESGDDNTKKIHSYARGRKQLTLSGA